MGNLSAKMDTDRKKGGRIMGVVGKVEKYLDLLTEGISNLVAFFLATFTILVFLQVLTRFVIQISLPWTEELSRYFFIWMVFAGCTVGVRRRLHYQILFIMNWLPEAKKRILEGFVDISIILFFFLILTRSMEFANLIKSNKSPVLMFSMAIPYSSVVAFGTLGFIFAIENFMKSFFSKERPVVSSGKPTEV